MHRRVGGSIPRFTRHAPCHDRAGQRRHPADGRRRVSPSGGIGIAREAATPHFWGACLRRKWQRATSNACNAASAHAARRKRFGPPDVGRGVAVERPELRQEGSPGNSLQHRRSWLGLGRKLVPRAESIGKSDFEGPGRPGTAHAICTRPPAATDMLTPPPRPAPLPETCDLPSLGNHLGVNSFRPPEADRQGPCMSASLTRVRAHAALIFV